MPLVVSLLAILAVVPGDSLEIRYVGNAGFELYDGFTTVLIDLPYESGAFDLMTCAAERTGRAVDARRVILHYQFPDRRLQVCGKPEVVTQGQSFSVGPAA